MVTVDPAIAAEAAWLNGDPTVTGLLGQVLPYVRENPPNDARVCWLFRSRLDETRVSTGKMRLTHALQLRVRWPSRTAGATVDQLQASLDAAVAALTARIRGPLQDKTHGYFDWVAEATYGAPAIAVSFLDPYQCIQTGIPFQADLAYTAVQEING